MKKINISNFSLGEDEPLTVICGPCVIESEMDTLRAAEALFEIFSGRGVQFIFKSSYDKANRTSIHSYRGPGLDEGLRILQRVKEEFNIPIFTDVHTPEEAKASAEVCDVIQIPAFLSRQTDLIVAAGESGAVVNIKKGQFMAPWDMQQAIDKLLSTGNDNILLTDRGTSFGYNNLVSDMRAIPIMQKMGYPVLFDATHSVQLPGGLGSRSGGQREFVQILARAAVAVGCEGLYVEAHSDPKNAKSDAESMIPFNMLPSLIDEWERIHDAVKGLRV